MTNLITLTTDFGLIDGFVGVMKGVILSINPDVRIVDVTHDVKRQDIQQGAFLLANSIPYFPPAIHVCVVDPGVGSSRAALAIQVGESTLIGPDNGVLSLAVEVLRAKSGALPHAFRLMNPKYWLDPVSTTFHGRDVFSPSAAYLSRGVPLTELGSPAEEYITIAPSRPELRPDGWLVGHVIYIDRYGNIVSDIDQTMLARLGKGKPVVVLGGRHIHGLVGTYSDVELGEFAALIGSPWKLEVARRQGNAADALGVSIGDEIKVRAE